MSLKFSRQKDRHFFLSLWYKLDKFLPLPRTWKLRWYLDMEWIFERLAHERSFQVFIDHPVREKTFAFLKSHLSSGHRVLDLGCGEGTLSNQIAAQVSEIIAIDHNAGLTASASARFKAPNLKFETGDAAKFLSENSKPFDVLILSHVLEHLDNPEAFLREHAKHFSSIYIEVPDLERTPLNEYRQKLKSSLSYADTDHIWEFDRDDMIRLLGDCGLRIADSEYRFGVQKYWCKTR